MDVSLSLGALININEHWSALIRNTQSYTVSTLFVMTIDGTQKKKLTAGPEEQTGKVKLWHEQSADLKWQ